MTQKKNYWGQVIQTLNGALSFGVLSEDQTCTSAVEIKGKDGRHFIDLTENGERKGWTTINAPGAIQINAGEDLKQEQDGIFFNSENGDIIIRARNGKIRIEGLDIEITATGSGKQGFITTSANNGFKLDANNITLNAKEALKLLATGLLSLTGKLGMEMKAPSCNGASAAAGSKKQPGTLGRS
jgi:hypothetical protein